MEVRQKLNFSRFDFDNVLEDASAAAGADDKKNSSKNKKKAAEKKAKSGGVDAKTVRITEREAFFFISLNSICSSR